MHNLHKGLAVGQPFFFVWLKLWAVLSILCKDLNQIELTICERIVWQKRKHRLKNLGKHKARHPQQKKQNVRQKSRQQKKQPKSQQRKRTPDLLHHASQKSDRPKNLRKSNHLKKPLKSRQQKKQPKSQQRKRTPDLLHRASQKSDQLKSQQNRPRNLCRKPKNLRKRSKSLPHRKSAR